MIVSIHIPRTGGTSFLHYLRAQFGVRLLEDYSWAAAGADPRMMDDYDCIHGHFFSRRYRRLASPRFACWFREPFDRLRSHYSFWLENDFPDNRLWSAMRSEHWSFEQFATSADNSVRNLQSQLLDVLQIHELAFVGLTEQYERSLSVFERVFALPPRGHEIRARQTRFTSWGSLSAPSINTIRRLHAEDFELYEQAKRRFADLAAAYNL